MSWCTLLWLSASYYMPTLRELDSVSKHTVHKEMLGSWPGARIDCRRDRLLNTTPSQNIHTDGSREIALVRETRNSDEDSGEGGQPE
jgi:hypothetical protein